MLLYFLTAWLTVTQQRQAHRNSTTWVGRQSHYEKTVWWVQCRWYKMKTGKKTSYKVVSRLHNTLWPSEVDTLTLTFFPPDAKELQYGLRHKLGCCRFKNCWMLGFKLEQMSVCKSNLWNCPCQDCLWVPTWERLTSLTANHPKNKNNNNKKP